MHKYFFVFFFGFFLTVSSVQAQSATLSSAECETRKGSCNFYCVDGQTKLGLCGDRSFATGNNCCAPIATFTTVSCENRGGICKKSLGGGCEDSAHEAVGMCSDTSFESACCIPKDIVNVTKEKCETAITSGGLGGSCQPTCALDTLSNDSTAEVSCGEGGFGNNLYCCVSELTKKQTEEDSGVAAVGAVNIGTKYTPLENVPFIDGTTFEAYVLGLYRLGLILIVLSAVFMLVIGGFTYLTSAGNTAAISSAKHIIYGSLIGLVLALVSYIILNTINPDLVNVNVTSFQPLAIRNSSGGEGSDIGGEAGSGGGGNCTTIPESQLKAFPKTATDGGSDRRGLPDTVDRFMNMHRAALRESITLRAGEAYRSPQEQSDLWQSHGCRIVSGKTVCSKALVAVPCSIDPNKGSNHTRGTAIDINGVKGNPAALNWLRNNAAQYGFYNKIASEPWHWSDTGR